MVYRPDLTEDDDYEPLHDGPAPTNTIAGAQTKSDQVKQRISEVRNPSDSPASTATNNMSSFDLGPKPMEADPEKLKAALGFEKQGALTAGIGRALNALSAGTGYKPDNGVYDAIESQGKDVVSQAQADVKNRQQLVKDWIAGKAKQAENAENRDFRQRQLDQTQQGLNDRHAETIAQRNLTSQLSASSKNDARQNKAYTDTLNSLEQMRGNPAVQQAEKDVYAADKVKSLINQAGGDPNNLNPQFVKLLVSEVGKIAQGGSPSVDELRGLTPSTLQGSLAGIWQKFSNNPTPANAGAFIKQYQSYADTVAGDAKKLIKDRYSRIIDSKRRLLSDEDTDTLNTKYVNRFESPGGAPNKEAQPQAASHAPGSIVQVKGVKYKVGSDGDSLEPI